MTRWGAAKCPSTSLADPPLHGIKGGSELAEQILEPALALGSATQAEYTLLRVVPAMVPGGSIPVSVEVSGLREPLFKQMQALHGKQSAEAQDYLDRLAERLRAGSLTVQTRVVSHEQPAAAILDDAQKNAVDLIALAGAGWLQTVAHGERCRQVVRGAATSVLVYRPAG